MTAETTLPQLLRRNARSMAGRPAIREKDRGIWQTYTWAQYWDEVRDFRARPRRARLLPRRQAGGDRRQPAAALFRAARRAMPRRYRGAGVPGRDRHRAGLCADHAEVSVVVAEDQEQVDKILSLKTRLPHLELVVYDDPRGLGHYSAPGLASFDAVQAAGGEFGETHPRLCRGRDRHRRGRRSGAALLHFGHDRAAQGRDAVARQSVELGRGVRRRRRHPPDRRHAVLPADGVDRRLAVLAGADAARRLHAATPGKARDGAARSARAGPDDRAGAAADLGEHADPAPGARQRRLAAQAPGVRLFPGAGRAGASCAKMPAARRSRRRGSAWRSAICWSTRRCATSWASAAPAGSIPAARRSAPTRSAFSARSGSTSSRSTARPS